MNIFIIHHRTKHHAKHSGYAKLVDVMDAEVIYPDKSFSYTMAKGISKLYSKKKGVYDTSSVLKNIALFKTLLNKRKDINIVHFLNGERDVRHLWFFKWFFPNTKFIATLHKPPNILKILISDVSSLKKLDGIIVVGKSQKVYVEKYINPNLVHYIPHGVDTQFFKPSNNKDSTKQVLYVGQHLRCFDTLNEVVRLLHKKHPEINICIVVSSATNSIIETYPNVIIINKVDDLKLLDIYQKSKMLFLPLQDVTACNSILEALACGLPIITSDLESSSAYLKDSKNKLLNNNADVFVKAILEIINNKDVAEKLSKNSRKLALDYDWSVVSERILEFYKKVTIEKQT